LALVSHECSLFLAAALQLAGLAVYTGRTLVLPVLKHDGRQYLRTVVAEAAGERKGMSSCQKAL
jgi:hypothetical protein